MRMRMRMRKKKSQFYCIKMESQKIINLPEKTADNNDLLKKRINKKKNYSNNKEIRIKTPMLRSDLCDFSGAYIVVKGEITVTNPNDTKKKK